MNECKNGTCQYIPPQNRKSENPQTEKEIKYARLYGEIVMPKLKEGKEYK